MAECQAVSGQSFISLRIVDHPARFRGQHEGYGVLGAEFLGVRGYGPGQTETGLAEQIALHQIDAPLPQKRGIGFRLHPFGNRADVEIACQVDERADIILIVGIAGEIAAERPVELENIHRHGAEVAERGEARAEIVDGDAAAEFAQLLDEADGFAQVAQRHCLGDLDDQAAGDIAVGGQNLDDLRIPARVGGGRSRHVEGQSCVRELVQRGHRHLHHGTIDQAHQTELLGNWNKVTGGNDLARLVGHAQQGLMEGGNPVNRRHHRLEGETETFLAQAADDFGGAVGVELTLGISLLRRAVDDIAVGRQFARLGQGLFGAGDGGAGVGGVFRQDERADRQQGPDRPALRLDDAFARHA